MSRIDRVDGAPLREALQKAVAGQQGAVGIAVFGNTQGEARISRMLTPEADLNLHLDVLATLLAHPDDFNLWPLLELIAKYVGVRWERVSESPEEQLELTLGDLGPRLAALTETVEALVEQSNGHRKPAMRKVPAERVRNRRAG